MSDKFITLPQLTKAVKGLVNKVNAEVTMTDSKIGNLSNLTTSATGNLVAAINEAASSSAGTAGVTSFNGATGAITYTAPVTSVDGATGAVTLNYVPKVTTGADRIVSIYTGATGDNDYPGIGVSDNFGSSNIRFYDGIASIRNAGYDSQHEYNHEIRMSYTEGGLSLSSYVDDIDTNPTEWAGITIGPGNISISSGATQSVGIYDLINPTTDYQAAHKKYVDDKFSAITYPVTSVNGATGAVTLNIPSSYVSSFNGATGAITYEAPVTSVNGATGIVTITATGIGAQSTISINKNDTAQACYPLVQTSTGNFAAYITDGFKITTSGTTNILQIGKTGSAGSRIGGKISLVEDAIGKIATIIPNGGMTSNINLTLPAFSGALALRGKINTTAGEDNTEYNLIGVQSSYTNTGETIPYNPGLISFAKTSSLARLTIGSTATPGVVRIYTSADSASGFTDIKSNASSTNERTITLPDASGTIALTTDIPSVPSWAMASSKPSYTFSELTSHPTTLNDYGITDAYTKTEVDGLISGVLHYKGAKSTTGALPSSGNTTGDVWHVTANGSEWAWDGSTWQELGTAIDLSGYLQTGDIAAWAKAANKPSYTASEVGALPSSTSYVSSFNGATGAITYTPPVTSVNGNTGAVTITAASITAASATHAHGNITSGGDITTTATIASGDRLVINDESASKITNSSITFGSSTAQYLANDGTWQAIPTRYNASSNTAGYLTLADLPIYDGSVSNLS